jgi:hypothetical protein
MVTYTILLDPDPDDGGYIVTVPALPGCVTEGETVVECLQSARLSTRRAAAAIRSRMAVWAAS